ncbi:T9SS type A sorting domain-containing protein [Rudanella lutea]|uniref:Ig-like domain-containing protein n=1 Tax=Rudanella lutea TaxID=451374 RepID=UPI00039EADEF
MRRILLLFGLLLICSFLRAQPLSLSILYGPPDTPPETWSTGNVFQVGNQVGDVAIYALFGGSGNRSFQIFSPGENITKTVSGTGYFNIRPTSSTVIDRTKILNFSGTVTGSVNITVRTLPITTQLSVTGSASPGSTLPVFFSTGVGTFPVGLGFQVQLLDANGNFIQNLSANPAYTSREPATYSSGDLRSIPASLPTNLAAGTYRVRVSSTGLPTTITGTSSAAFQVQPSLGTINTVITNVTPHTICTGYSGSIELTWTATDNGLQTQNYTIGVYSENATSAINPVRLIPNQGIYTSTAGTAKAMLTTTTLLNSLPVGRYKLAILHATATTNASLSNLFVVASQPSAIISDGTTNINEGEAASIRLTFSGQGPWSYSYNDLRNGIQTVTNTTNNPVLLPVYPTSDYLFSTARLLSFSGYCGTGTVTGSSQIRVSRLSLAITGVSHPNTCPGNTLSVNFTVSGNITAGTRYRLQLSDASGSFANPREIASGTSSPLTGVTPTNDAPGTGYKIRIVADSNLPPSATADLVFTRPSPPSVTDYGFCIGSTPPTITAIGSNLQWFSDDNIAQSFGGTAPVPPSDRSSSYRVSQTVNGCPSSTALVRVIANSKSSAPIVSTPVTYCQNGSASALTAQGVGLQWYSANQQSLGSNAPIPNTGNIGNQTFYVSQNQNGCPSDLTAVVVTVTAPPAAPTVSTPASVCQFAQVANTVLSAAVTGQDFRWYTNETGGIGSTQAPTPRTSTEGVEVYFVSQIINGCESSRARVQQTVIKAPDRPSVTTNPVLYCLNDSPRSLTASGTGLRWYQQATGGTFTTDSPSPNTSRVGTLTYYVSQVSGSTGCESPRTQVDAQVLAQPNPPDVVTNQFICQNSVSTPLRASGVGLQWSGPGITGTSSTAPMPPNSMAGTLTYQVRQQIGSCLSPASTIQVTIRPQPVAPTVESPLKLCLGSATQNLAASGSGLRWYNTPDGNGTARDQISFSPNATGVFNFYVKQVVNDCESPLSRLEVRVSVPARATLSGDSIVTLYDSTAIRIRFTGDAPYNLVLWNGKTITTSNNPFIVWEKPTASTTYSLRSLKNDCGTGDVGNSYRLTVLTPLATDDTPFSSGLTVRVYPNPVTAQAHLEWLAPVHETATINVVSMSGLTVWSDNRKGTGTPQTESISVDNWPPGIYMIMLNAASGKALTRVLVTP